jgi:hypothetical protein
MFRCPGRSDGRDGNAPSNLQVGSEGSRMNHGRTLVFAEESKL